MSTPARHVALARQALAAIEDPEIPGVNLVELGVIRYVRSQADGALEVGLTPTYTGCPATEVIRDLVRGALAEAKVGAFRIQTVLSPAWSSDWITPQGRRQLQQCGIAPPIESVASMDQLRRGGSPVACPRCRSIDTERLSEFGSTPCKALYRCGACLEPFELFKCI